MTGEVSLILHFFVYFTTRMSNQRNNLVKVELRVYKPLSDYSRQAADYFVAVTGPGLQLGYDDINKAPRCKNIRNNLWIKDLWMPRNSQFHFKFLVVKAINNATVDVENVEPRYLFVGQRSIEVNTKYNQNGLVTKEDGPQQRKPMVGEKNKTHKTKRIANESLQMKINGEKMSLQVNGKEEGSIKVNGMDEKSFARKNMEDLDFEGNKVENIEAMKVEDATVQVKHMQGEKSDTNNVDDQKHTMKKAEECIKITQIDVGNAIKEAEEVKDKLKIKKDDNDEMKLLEDIKMEPSLLNTKTDVSQLIHVTGNARDNVEKSSTGFAFNGKKICLAAAGVAVVSCIGYFVFR